MNVIQSTLRTILICGILWSTVDAAVVYAQDEFEIAAQALEDGDTDAAITTLESIISAGKVSPELYTNLGKAYYLSGQNGPSILAYERALKLSPHDKDILNSITNVRQELDVRLTDVPDFVLVTILRGLVQSLSPTSWVILQILTGLIALACLYLLWFREDIGLSTKLLKIVMIVSAILFLIAFLFSHQAKQYQQSDNTGIVMVETTSVSQAPDDLSPEITEVGEGVKVWITDELGDWFKVILRDKDEGWIKKSEVEII